MARGRMAQAPSQPRGARRGPPVTAEKTSRPSRSLLGYVHCEQLYALVSMIAFPEGDGYPPPASPEGERWRAGLSATPHAFADKQCLYQVAIMSLRGAKRRGNLSY